MDKFTGMNNTHELRIGNCVLWNGEIKRVVAVTASNYLRLNIVAGPGENEVYIKDVRPVPITPELLKKCGFRKDDSDDLARLGVQYILDLPIKGECRNEIFFFFSAPGLKDVSFGEYTVNSAHGSNNIYHLHQLQNLFYCLTGQELEIHL